MLNSIFKTIPWYIFCSERVIVLNIGGGIVNANSSPVNDYKIALAAGSTSDTLNERVQPQQDLNKQNIGETANTFCGL